jgi:hypothetical protein
LPRASNNTRWISCSTSAKRVEARTSTQRSRQTTHVGTFPAAAPSQNEFELHAAGHQIARTRLGSCVRFRVSHCVRRTLGLSQSSGANSWGRSIHRPALTRSKSLARRRLLASELPSATRNDVWRLEGDEAIGHGVDERSILEVEQGMRPALSPRDIDPLETKSAAALDDAASRNDSRQHGRPSVERCFTRRRMASDVAALSPANCFLSSMPDTAPCRTTERMNDYASPLEARGQVARVPHAKDQNIALAEQEICRRVTRKGQQHRYRRPPLKGGRFAPFDQSRRGYTPTSPALGRPPIADGWTAPASPQSAC